jgi:hypothetical protein
MTKKDPKIDIIEKIEHHIRNVYGPSTTALENRLEIFETTKKLIEKLDGFTFKQNGGDWSATRNGVKFIFSYVVASYSRYLRDIRTLTERGGWSRGELDGPVDELNSEIWRGTSPTLPDEVDIDRVVAYMTEIADLYVCPEVKRTKAVLKKSDLPEPLTFSDAEEIPTGHESWAKRIKSVIAECVVMQIVGISDKAIPDASIAAKPGEDTWFLLDCSNALHATFNIITDGEVFHPADRKNRYKIVRRMKPKKSVDLSMMCATDKKIVAKAIEDFVSKI